MKRPLAFSALLALATASIQAGPLTEARIARIINDVTVIKPTDGVHPASLNELVKDDMAVKTGIKSRSELLFQDETLTRLGPETLFSFKTGTRDMSLERGAMLLQVPKGIGGAKIHSASVTAAITGTTIMMEHVPGKTLKVLVLEGSLRLSVNGRLGDSLLLLPGKMVIMPPNAKRIPDPISVDIAKVMKTSALVNMGGTSTPLPSVGLIQTEIATQAKIVKRQELVATNLAIEGNGSELRLVMSDVSKVMDTKHPAAIIQEPAPTSTGDSTPISPVATPGATPSVSPAAPSTDASPSPAPTLDPTSAATPTPTPSQSLDGTSNDPIDDATNANFGSNDAPVKDVIVDKPVDLSADGKHGNFTAVSKGKIEVKKSLKVSSNGANGSKAGGNVTLDSRKTKEDAIVITDSAEILSLLSTTAPGHGGVIKFSSSGGKIRVDRTSITAERGTIDIRNEGSGGVIALNKSNLAAETIKLQTLGDKGQLNIAGGSLDANTAIDLFATGSNGQVNFTDNTTLSGNSVKRIAGDTVTVNNGKTVTVNGPSPASIFTNHPNYTGSGGNGSTTGTFGGNGATTQPLATGSGPGH